MMRPPRRLAALVIACCVTSGGMAWAKKEWPVRLNVAMPVGHTSGSERLQGFTWGFRGSATAYPVGRLAVGGYAEMLLDFETHSMSSFGASIAHPLRSWRLEPGWMADWRVGAYGGVRYSGEGTDSESRFATGVFTDFVLPAYLYEFRLGVRIDGTFHDGLSATMILVDVDISLLFAALGSAYRVK